MFGLCCLSQTQRDVGDRSCFTTEQLDSSGVLLKKHLLLFGPQDLLLSGSTWTEPGAQTPRPQVRGERLKVTTGQRKTEVGGLQEKTCSRTLICLICLIVLDLSEITNSCTQPSARWWKVDGLMTDPELLSTPE